MQHSQPVEHRTLLELIWTSASALLLISWWIRWWKPGIRKPVILLPEGLAERLSPAELRAAIAHELCHIQRRDNLTQSIHMMVEAIFWFHPLVWWIGGRLLEERERACDEDVLAMGNDAEAYADGILKVCEHYLESPLPCVAGVCGSNLKKRIEQIMTNRGSSNLGFAKAVPVRSGFGNSLNSPGHRPGATHRN